MVGVADNGDFFHHPTRHVVNPPVPSPYFCTVSLKTDEMKTKKIRKTKNYKQLYSGRWGVCTVLRPGQDLRIFNRGTFETCTFIYNPLEGSIRIRTEIIEGNRIKYVNEGCIEEIGNLPEVEQYIFFSNANYIMWSIEEEIEKDMAERLKGNREGVDCSPCYLDYKAINEIISEMKKYISPAVLDRYYYDNDLTLTSVDGVSKN